MKITLEQAEQLLKELPVCTVITECYGPEELVEFASRCTTRMDLIKNIYGLEEYDSERYLSCQDCGPELDGKIKEKQNWLSSVKIEIKNAVMNVLSVKKEPDDETA